ncbi:MAG: SO2930 family diheme c-type cytochrome [Pseudomonadota bacterium]
MRLFFVLLALTLAACAPKPLTPTFVAEGMPEDLAAWGMVGVRDGRLVLAEGAQPYELNTPLFTDYAGKLRTVWMPKGQSADWSADEAFDFPVGTVVSKTFFYPKAADGAVAPGDGLKVAQTGHGLDLSKIRLVETRILVRRKDGWAAFPYVWNDRQTEATLKRTGQSAPMTLARPGRRDAFVYQVPNVNQCAGCHATDHATKKLQPIGLKARHLNRDGQLERLAAIGYLRGLPAERPKAAVWTDEGAGLDARARAWLDINCAHCHSPTGPADTSGLYLTPAAAGPQLGLCKPPIAAGQGTGGFRFGIHPGKPEESILVFRTASTDPGAMMPELGRALVHDEGLSLLRRWIAAMPGSCG